MQQLDIKRTLNFKRLMLAVAMTACVASQAYGATLKPETVLMHDRVTVGDVFDGVTVNADFYLAPAPAPGKTLTLNVADLTRISEALHLGWVPQNNREQAVLRRASGEISLHDVQSALQKKLAEEKKGQKFEMELSDRSVSFRIPDSMDRTVNVENLSYDALNGSFRATVSPAAFPQTKKEVKGRLYEISRLPVLKNPLRQDDVISVSDIDYIDIRSGNITSTMVVDAAKLVGMTPRRGIAAMKPVIMGDVQMPLVVKKGDLVTMTMDNSVISLTAQGRALDNGAEGEAIRVMNTSSKRVISAVITGPETVNIKAPALSVNTL